MLKAAHLRLLYPRLRKMMTRRNIITNIAKRAVKKFRRR
jgi:hypothetical protein